MSQNQTPSPGADLGFGSNLSGMAGLIREGSGSEINEIL